MYSAKTLFTSAALSAAALFMATNSQASDGTLNFTGSITDVACTVNTPSQEVNLGSISAASLNGAAGKRAAETQFNIELLDCPADSSVEVKFDGPADAAYPELLELNSGATTATGVAIELSDREQSHIKLGQNSKPYAITTGANTLTFYAGYMSTAETVTAGEANATAQFTLVYP